MFRILLLLITTLVVVDAYDDIRNIDESIRMNLRSNKVKHLLSATNSHVWNQIFVNDKDHQNELRRELMASGGISLDELNAEMDSVEKISMDFKTVSVNLNISPVETSLDESEERIRMFERGYLEFLRSVLNSREGHAPIDVLSVEVIKSQFEQESDHSINVECNIATFSDNSLSKSEVSEIIANISDEFSSHIVKIWSDIEETLVGNLKSIKGDDFAEHAMYFRLVQTASVSSTEPLGPSTDDLIKNSQASRVFLYVALSVGCLAATLFGVAKMKLFTSRTKREKMEGNFSFKDPNVNLYDLDDIELTPTRSIFATTMENIGNISPFPNKKDKDYQRQIERFDQSRKKMAKYKAPARRSGYNRISSTSNSTDDDIKPKHSECWAPPGKLGVAIDTVNGKPVVHRVKEGSPLEGILETNDIILGIDEINTTNMSAADVTYLMVKKMKKRRKITFMKSEKNDDPKSEEHTTPSHDSVDNE